jgi:hypothetical protein
MLNSRERAQLHAIESALWAEDPALGHLLSTGRERSPGPRRAALLGFLLGVLGVLGGMVAFSTVVVAASVVLAVVGGGFWLWFSGAVTPGR